MSARPSHVVIVGRDAALWLTAAALAEALGPTGLRVTAIELPTLLRPSSAYATLPAIEALHARIGVHEAALLGLTGGSFSLGWNVARTGQPPFFLAHGAYGAPIEGSDFFQLWARARAQGLNIALEDFSPTAMAARHGRLLLPDEDMNRFGRSDYGYHLPAIPYVSVLKTRASELGVTIREAADIAVERDGETGALRSVTPDGAQPVAGDLFVDASGPDSILLGGALGAANEDWSEFFGFDRLLTARAKRFAAIPVYGELRAAERSWTALSATPSATYVSHAYRASEGDEDALAAADATTGDALQDATVTSIRPGIRRSAWTANCVAIGNAACALDPLFDLDLHVAQLGIVHLLSLFPNSADHHAERVEYDRITRSAFKRLRDFQAAFHVLAGWSSSAPEPLEQKLRAFRARGVIAPMEDETFTGDQWRALFVGLGLLPDSWAPAIDAMPADRMKDGFRHILGFVRTKVLEQPTHDQYLADIGAGRSL